MAWSERQQQRWDQVKLSAWRLAEVSACGFSIMISNRSTGLAVSPTDLLTRPACRRRPARPTFHRRFRPHARPDADASLLLPFDGDLADPNGLQPSVAESVSFTPGRFGQAVLIESREFEIAVSAR